MARSLKKRRRCRTLQDTNEWLCCQCGPFTGHNTPDRTQCRCGHPRCKTYKARPREVRPKTIPSQLGPSLWKRIRKGVSL